MLFFVGISALISNIHFLKLNDYAHHVLGMFISSVKNYYGEDSLVYNMHSLIHLSEDVKNLGPLDSFSAFKYENFRGSLKRMLQKGGNPLQQLCKRVIEQTQFSLNKNSIHSKTVNFEPDYKCVLSQKIIKEHTTNIKGIFFSKVDCASYSLMSGNKDACVLLKNKKIY